MQERHPVAPERHPLERHSDQALRLSSESDDETDAMASPNLLADTVSRQHSQAS